MQFNQIIDWLQGSRAEQTARGVAMLLGIWLLYRMASLVWQIVPAPELPEPAVEKLTAAPLANQRPRLNVAEVVNWHLFGSSDTPAPGASTEAAPIDAPDTRLNLVLRGVLSSDDPKEARAIIAEPSGEENFFAVGATVPGDAELKEIYADRIILMRAGRHETLRLPREDVQGVDAGAGQSSAVAAPSAQILGGYRDQMRENPMALMDLARAVPVPNPSGGLSGFRLFPGKKPALFAQLGLQAGDLVKEVNGLTMDNPMRGAELMQMLEGSDQLELRIERAGKEITMSVAIP